MNPANLTAKETLRICTPITDLELRLFDIASDLQDELDSARSELAENEFIYNHDDCSRCENTAGAIRSVIDLIESGKIDDGLKKLKAII